MHKNRLIPFKLLPSSWGLSGPAYDEAEARYTLEGFALEERLAEIQCSDEVEFHQRLLDLRLKYGFIDQYEYDVALAEMLNDEVEREVAIVEAKLRAEQIDPIEAEKEIFTLRGEPWIRVINDGLDPNEGINGYYFEFDWNDTWIAFLRSAGYNGPTEEAIIQAWFQDVCRSEASASMGLPPINGGIVVG